ncbi:hypothetical protein LOZ53_003171 [Ophidiomyces ophidiicola]|uniref:Uncharacterized protein n=1 Tax=Ophidiomyces ophidiicola TaxID=1387563 RepID=A0ACB8V079_9EURO|nr:uncharacterized protein LOZ57_003863 [Ophidiomyces ophidiicola]KAI1920751.1 hypothetical protein LOZ64_001800 [Ophidiomyces ophidiicola]KAI1946112.1 hypothetical protein LOZ57_003863 [Ophidiomyces ophidiicola]KAI1948195.1 hypothetical protein LOZ62_002712 [Ophidiomyces ophidiicola]KAI1969371.1 hypothetical protein LOZ56_004463 [Ophidiomyces ophidiicola]KAI1978368.1 hypothetical protein LOZ55_002696 [Ophidiomyces ophidiicola]
MGKKSSRAPKLELGQSNFDNASNTALPSSSPKIATPITPVSPLSATGSSHKTSSSIRPVTARSAFPSDRSIKTAKSTGPSAGKEDGEPPPSADITAIPPYPPSPKESTKHGRDTSKSFFTNFKASRSTNRVYNSDTPNGRTGEDKPVSRGSSRDRGTQKSKNQSSLSASPPKSSANSGKSKGEIPDDKARLNQVATNGKAIDDADPYHTLTSKRSKPRFANLLTRTRSIRVDDALSPVRPSAARRPSNSLLRLEEISKEDARLAMKTAPLQPERSFNDAMGSTVRNRSVDRPPTEDRSNNSRKDKGHISSSLNQVTGSSIFSNIKQTSTGAADRLGRAGKGFLGKITKSGSIHERDSITDDNYVCSVINLPLVEQTRRTRISKRLEASKDKTEYWMPALPWRCIDYLNFKGCEEEGLYRVPGSGKDIKHWQRRFDTELDINLFDEPELYDVNTIGSMFKAWLRELPDEIFPKATQAMIAEKCPGATKAPQLLKDELSKLPPFNYYLLFAITCHLSLLHSYVDKNKMDYRNLCICFQPCMKIDGFCFQFLVCDWKNCWQGCWTEKEHLEVELEHERKLKEAALKKTAAPAAPPVSEPAAEERTISSSGSSQPMEPGGSSGTATKASSRSTSLKKGRKTPPNIDSNHLKVASRLPELGPPLSPIEI